MPSSQNAQIFILKSFFAWLFDEEYIPKNPALKLKLTKEPIRLRQPLTEEQMEIFREACVTDREKALTEFLFSSASRLSDAVTISISDINWEECTGIVIGKANKQREIYFSIKTKILLQKYIANRKGKSDALFITEKYPFNRVSDRTIERIVTKINERSGLNINVFPHKFRHTRATELSEHGMPLQIISKVLGHSSISTTMIYTKVSKENILHNLKTL